MVATTTSSNIRARGKVMCSGRAWWRQGRSCGSRPSGSRPRPSPRGPLTCARRVMRQLVLGRGDTGHVGPFHVSQAVIVPEGTVEVFVHGEGGQPGHRQGDLGHARGKHSRRGLLGGPARRGRGIQGREGWEQKQRERRKAGQPPQAGGGRRLTWPCSWRGRWAGSRLWMCRQRPSS